MKFFFDYLRGFVKFRKLFIRIGNSTLINKNIKIEKKSHFADYSIIEKNKDSDISLGKNFYLGYFSIISCQKNISVGENVIIGPHVKIYDHDHKFEMNNESLNFSKLDSEKIIIGNNVWIGASVTILKGSKIGDNVVVAANTIVRGNLKSNFLYYGYPNKFKKLNK